MNPFRALGTVLVSDISDARIFEGPERYLIHMLTPDEVLRFMGILKSDMRDAGPVIPRLPWFRRHKHGFAQWTIDMTVRGSGGFRASWAEPPAIMIERRYWILPEAHWNEGKCLAKDIMSRQEPTEQAAGVNALPRATQL